MMKKIIYSGIIFFVSLLILSCDNKDGEEVTFSYNSIIDKEYRFSIGRIIPVTIGKSIETDGDISLDSKFFYYSSNREGGNFDIYLRSMRDITTVRLTSHPSKDINPVVSPDGKSVAFVSFRDDPEGDIFVIEHKASELIEKAADSTTRLPSLDKKAINLTLKKDSQTDVVINIKDSSPAWSPDGKLIAYSSSRGNITGDADIWVMEPDGKNKRKITSGGADFASFSSDGKKILFVSYRNNRKGDICIIEIGSGKETLIASGSHIKMDPRFAGNTNEIIYSSIETDTNKNGKLDLQDRSIIRYLNIKSGLTYPLTRKSLSSFKGKWLPVLQTRDYAGVILFTDIRNESINLNIIPEKGIVPKKLNARQQYDICDDYLTEYEDPEKYTMALESVFYFFGNMKDPSSVAYVNRALGEAASFYQSLGYKEDASKMISFLKGRIENKDLYAGIVLESLEKSSGKFSVNDAGKSTAKLAGDEKNLYFAPFAIEDMADLAYKKNDPVSALKLYNIIIKDYSSFERILDIHTKAAVAGDDLKKGILSESAEKIINEGRTNQKITLIKYLAADFEKKKYNISSSSEYLKSFAAMKEKYSSSKKIIALLHYTSGLVLENMGDKEKAAEEYSLSIEVSHPNDITYYLSNIRLGDIARNNRQTAEAEKYLSAAINRYSRRFETANFRENLIWTIKYYEKAGEKSEAVENYKEASEIYEKYINMITLTYNKRLFVDVYSEYAPRAHILYIDSIIALKGADGIAELEKSYTDRLPIYRMDFNKAALYGLGYIYTQKGLSYMRKADSTSTDVSIDDAMKSFKKADSQIEWALFIDDTFIEPYLLKTWIYQYIDTERKNRGRSDNSAIAKYFPERLWEENIQILEKALDANDESIYPENEGNINLNMANNYFLLLNYPRALRHYKEASKYKKLFNSEIEKALFHFHYGYCFWQNGETGEAKGEIEKSFNIYKTMAASAQPKTYANQYLILYRYFALINRYEGKYDKAIEWYEEILSFADHNSISIDKARYLQEIAHCYIEKGELESASIFISRAKSMLNKYPNDERKYYLTIRLFGVVPIPLFNMGADSSVIGDNKIFYPLDRESKKLLNIAMLEEISLKNNDFSEAISLQEEKLKLLEKSKTSVAVESRIRSLNNIGYYYYESGKFNEAEKYFALSRKASSENNNLEGLFTSIMNLTNLYALLIENNIVPERDWLKDTEILSASIDKYSSSYYELRFKEEKEALESAAKAKKLKVDSEDIKRLEKRIKEETSQKYFALEIASAILKFYRGELLFTSISQNSESGFNAAHKVIENNQEIYNLYRDALLIFERNYKVAESREQKALMTKLLFNMASCYEKIGETEKAYVSLIDAKDLADENRYTWLQIDSSYRMARFLALSGMEVEKKDYKILANKNFESAVKGIEETPLLYAVHYNRVKVIYNDYINFLINNNNSVKGFMLSEKKLRILRLMAINSLSPKFSNGELTSLYYSYTGDLKKLDNINRSISSILESDNEENMEKLKGLEKKSALIKENLEKIRKAISSENIIFGSYISAGEVKIPVLLRDVYKFHNTGENIFYWKISKGEITSGTLVNQEEIASLIKKDSDTDVFVIVNDTLLSILKEKPEFNSSLRLITGIDRAQIFLNMDKGKAPSLLSSINGIEGKIKTKELHVHLKDSTRNIRDYSIVIEKAGEVDSLTPEMIFASEGIAPSCLVMYSDKLDYSYTAALLEAGVYAGISSVVFSLTDNPSYLASAADSYYSGNPISSGGENFIIAGDINSFAKGSEPGNAEKEKSGFMEAMAESKFDIARMRLSRWNSLIDEKWSFEYFSKLWLLELLKGDFASATMALESALPVSDTEKAGVVVRKIYHLLYTGDFKNAAKIFNSNEGLLKNRGDYAFILSIIAFAESGPDKSMEIFNSIEKPYTTLLPNERYTILLSRYFAAAGSWSAGNIAKDIPSKSVMSLNEILSLLIPFQSGIDYVQNERFQNIIELKDESISLNRLKDSVLRMSVSTGGYDRFSPFPLTYALLYHEMYGVDDELFPVLVNIDPSGIVSQADTADSLYILSLLENLYLRYDKHSSAIPLQNEILKISKESGLSYITGQTLYRNALSSMIAGDLDNAYSSAIEAEKLIKEGSENSIDLQLLLMNLELRSSQYKLAKEKGDRLSVKEGLSMPQKYFLNLQLSMLELNRLSRLKSATPADANKFEALFFSSIEMLKSNISILENPGYNEVTEQVFDEYINYKMRTGQHTDAHYFNEIKKLSHISFKTGKNYLRGRGAIDIQAMQQALPADSVYFNISKNRDDLFVWLFDKKARRALVIENGYKQLNEFNEKFNPALMKRADSAKASSELYNILLPALRLIENNKNILISTDSFLEEIPFDIAGKERMLAEKAGIFYMVSPMLTDFREREMKPLVYTAGSSDSVIAGLEMAGIRHSGIATDSSPRINHGIAHITGDIGYNRKSRGFTIDKKGFAALVSGADLIYASVLFADYGFNSLAAFCHDSGSGIVILNTSALQDVNNAFFVEHLYSSIKKGDSVPEAFIKAAGDIRGEERFSLPGFWAGTRMYINNFDFAK